MRFRFNIRLTEEDYLNFNIFHLYNDPSSKKNLLIIRICLNVILFSALIFQIFVSRDIAAIIVTAVLLVIPVVLLNVFYNKYWEFMTKKQIRSMKKNGKLPFSPESLLEFYDNYSVEITPYTKTEHNYSSFERIYLSEHRYIYIYISSVQAYIIPLSAFSSEEHFNGFMNFISTKCSNITVI